MRILPVVLACALAAGSAAVVQQKLQAAPQENPATPPPTPRPGPSEQPRALVPVRVQIVLTRMKGEKKISSLPYQLGVTANDGQRTSLRMGVEVPVMTTVFSGGSNSASIPQTSFNYRNVGTNIDCRADSVSADVIKLSITVTDSTVHLESTKTGAGEKSGVLSDVPAFRQFNSTFTVLMRDGQTTQHTSAVDPINGEVMKIDVTLNVVK